MSMHTESPKEVLREADRGKATSTPFIALAGVHVIVALAVALVIAICVVAIFIAT
jgi:hypothetical protein